MSRWRAAPLFDEGWRNIEAAGRKLLFGLEDAAMLDSVLAMRLIAAFCFSALASKVLLPPEMSLVWSLPLETTPLSWYMRIPHDDNIAENAEFIASFT